MQGKPAIPEADLARQRQVVDAFLAAARGGDFEALVAVLDPDVVVRSDRRPIGPAGETEVHGAAAVAERAMKGGARAARAALVNGAVGIVIAPRGRLLMVLDLTIADGKIAAIDAIANPDHVRQLELALLPPPSR